MTYFVDTQGLIYWALGQCLQERRRSLRVVLSYVPGKTGGYRKCVFHGYDFEVERLRRACADEDSPEIAERVISLRRHHRRSGDQYLALPSEEVDRVYEPARPTTHDEGKLFDPGVLDALRKLIANLHIELDHVRFYGRAACELSPGSAQGDVDIVLDRLHYRATIEREAARRAEIPLDGLDQFFSSDPHRLAAVKRRWSLSQLELDVYGTTLQLDVKIAARRPPEHGRLFYDRSWGRLQPVDGLELEVTDATWAFSPAPLLWARTKDGTTVSISSKHYMFSGIATEDDKIKVTGVMDKAGERIALTDPVKHFVVVQLPPAVRFVE
jgi:hypothetical protein